MPGPMPAELAERLSDQANAMPISPAEYQHAREELIEQLLEGKNVGRFWLRDVLDEELQNNYLATIHDLAERLSGVESVYSDARVDWMQSLAKRLRVLVEGFVDRNPDLIEERAEELRESHD